MNLSSIEGYKLVEQLVSCFPDALLRKDRYGDLPIHHALHIRPYCSPTPENKTYCLVTFFMREEPRCAAIQSYKCGCTILHRACREHPKMVSTYTMTQLAQGWPNGIVQKDGNGYTPLHNLCQVSQHRDDLIELFNLFHQLQPSCLSIPDNEGRRPLDMLCENKSLGNSYQEQLVKLVLSLDPKVTEFVDNWGNLPVHRASISCPSIAALLLETSPKTLDLWNRAFGVPLHSAIRYGKPQNNTKAIIRMIQARPDQAKSPDESRENKILPLHIACKHGMAELIPTLVEAYPQALSWQDSNGDTPFHCAARTTKNQEVLTCLNNLYPQGFLYKNRDGQLPIACCGKDHQQFLHLVQLCPASLYHDSSTDSTSLNPGSAYLSDNHKLSDSGAVLLNRVFAATIPKPTDMKSENKKPKEMDDSKEKESSSSSSNHINQDLEKDSDDTHDKEGEEKGSTAGSTTNEADLLENEMFSQPLLDKAIDRLQRLLQEAEEMKRHLVQVQTTQVALAQNTNKNKCEQHDEGQAQETDNTMLTEEADLRNTGRTSVSSVGAMQRLDSNEPQGSKECTNKGIDTAEHKEQQPGSKRKRPPSSETEQECH